MDGVIHWPQNISSSPDNEMLVSKISRFLGKAARRLWNKSSQLSCTDLRQVLYRAMKTVLAVGWKLTPVEAQISPEIYTFLTLSLISHNDLHKTRINGAAFSENQGLKKGVNIKIKSGAPFSQLCCVVPQAATRWQ